MIPQTFLSYSHSLKLLGETPHICSCSLRISLFGFGYLSLFSPLSYFHFYFALKQILLSPFFYVLENFFYWVFLFVSTVSSLTFCLFPFLLFHFHPIPAKSRNFLNLCILISAHPSLDDHLSQRLDIRQCLHVWPLLVLITLSALYLNTRREAGWFQKTVLVTKS